MPVDSQPWAAASFPFPSNAWLQSYVIPSVDSMPSRLKLCLVILCAQHWMSAQTAPSPAVQPDAEKQPGSIAGTVRSDSTGQPLRRAQVMLSPADAGGRSLVQTTDDHGKFSFPKVLPATYAVSVQCDGYLKQTAGRIGAYKMPPIFLIQPGQDVTALDFRMVPTGVVTGKVKFDDAEPAMNVTIQLYREYYRRGRHGWAVAATTQTDDLGVYRAHGLEPGSYYVAALYRAPPPPPNAEEQIRTDASGKPREELSYAVTFYPEVQKLADAVAVRLLPGQEIASIDIFLTLVHTVRIHGRVLSALSGGVVEGPSITLRWNDAENTGSVSAPVDVTFDKNHNFEIKGVTPGPYIIITTGTDDAKTLTARTAISVGDADVEALSIVIGPQQNWKGKVVLDGDESTKLPGLGVELLPRRATASAVRAYVDENHEFNLPFLPQETYDLEVLDAPEDVYLEAVRVGKNDTLAAGLEAEPGAEPQEMEVVLSTRGGKVLGRAVTAGDSSVVATGASVLLIPDPPMGRSHAYKLAYADQSGNFLMHGVAPGNYIVVAWFDQPPCEVYNPNDLTACRAQGVKLAISDDALESVQVTAH
jgi:carboxypeptidase family protein